MTKKQKNCIKNITVDYSDCLPKCSGMDVVSFDKNDLILKLGLGGIQYDWSKDLDLEKEISQYSDRYQNYKENSK